MNNLTIAGFLGKDAELRHMPDGTPVLSFSVADSQGREKPTIWWSAQIFGKRAEALTQYLTKGQAVTVVGNVTQREYTDKDGNKRTSMDVRVSEIALQGGKRDSEPRKAPIHDAVKARQLPPRTANGFDNGDDIPW